MQIRSTFPLAITVILFFGGAYCAQDGTPAQVVNIEIGELSVSFRGNEKSSGLLSGIDSLRNIRHAPEYDAYDPDNPGGSAGVNFEHIISGHRNPNNKFTPREGPFQLYSLPDGKSVRLVRNAEDSPWKVASTLTYTVNEPYYVDLAFSCSPQNASLFGERGWGIFFFANYMNDVEEVPLHFLGFEEAGGKEQWIVADAPKTHLDWRGGGSYRSAQAGDLTYDEDVEFRLNSWSYDWPRFSRPFYYGRAGKGMTMILMFDRMCSERDQIRFSLFKFKLARYPRPAWDFQYVVNRVEPAQQYGFRARLVFKKFVSRQDCLHEYEQWKSYLQRTGASQHPLP